MPFASQSSYLPTPQPFPRPRRRWAFAVNNRISFSSLVQVTREFLYGIKNTLVTNGWTVKYSCDGTTGPANAGDHTDRWTDATKAGTRGANTSTAQSWIVLTDADGVDFMLSFTGSADNQARFAYSHGGNYTPAGTTTFPATATDEVVVLSGDFTNSTASGDRVYQIAYTTDKRNWRVWIYRDHQLIGAIFGVESFDSAILYPSTQPQGVTRWAFSVAAGSALSLTVNATFGQTRVTVGSTTTTCPCLWQDESTPTYNNQNLALQAGGIGKLARGISIHSNTSGNDGKIGNLIDWFVHLDTALEGATTPDLKMIHLYGGTSTGGGQGFLFPWDGATTPVIA